MAGPDNTPPILGGLSLTSTNTEAGNAPLTFTATVYDDSLDVATVTLQLDHAFVSGGQLQSSVTITFGPNSVHYQPGPFGNPFAGYEEDKTTFTLDQGTSTGTYLIQQATVLDRAGNQTTYTNAQLADLHVANSFTINAPPGPAPQPAPLQISIVGYLDNGGLPYLEFASNWSGGPSKIQVTFDHQLIPGQAGSEKLNLYYSEARFYHGQYYNDVSFNGWAPGTYHIASVTATYPSGDILIAANASPFQDSFTIVDRFAPYLATLSVPQAVHVYAGGGMLHLGVNATDESTIASIHVTFDHVLGVAGQGGPATIGSVQLVAGGVGSNPSFSYSHSGNDYFVDIPLLASDRGSYDITSVALTDIAGNSRTLTPSNLPAHNSFTIDTPPAIAGDFNGDGHSDLVWRNDNGALSTWFVRGMNGTQVQQSAYLAQVDPAWTAIETLDFNGDGRTDLLWRHTNGTISIWNGSNLGFQQGSYTIALSAMPGRSRQLAT